MSSSGFDDDDEFVPQQPSHFVGASSYAPSGNSSAVPTAHAKTRPENERGAGGGLYSSIPTSSLCPPPTLLSSSSSSSPASASSSPLPPQQVGSKGPQSQQHHQSGRRGEVYTQHNSAASAFHYHSSHTSGPSAVSATNTANTAGTTHHARGGGASSSSSRSPSSPALCGYGHHVTLFRHRRHIRLTSASATATICLDDTLLSVARTLLIPNTSEGMGKGAGGPSSNAANVTSSNNTNSNSNSGGGPSSLSSPSTSVASPAAAAAVGDGSSNNALLLSLPTVPSVLASPFGPIVLTPGPSAVCEAVMGIRSSFSSSSSHSQSVRGEGANKNKKGDDAKPNKKGNKSNERQGHDNEKDNDSEGDEYDPYAGLYDEDGLPIPQPQQYEDGTKGSSSSTLGGEQPSLTMPVTMSLPHCSLELYFDVPCDITVDIEGLSVKHKAAEEAEAEVGASRQRDDGDVGEAVSSGVAEEGGRAHHYWQKRRRIPSGPLQLMFIVCLNDRRTLNALFSTERKVSERNPAASLLCGVSPSSAAALKLAAERGQQQRPSSSTTTASPPPPPRHHQPYSLQQQSGGGGGGGIGGFLSSAASSLSSSAAPAIFGGSKDNSPSLHPSHPFVSSSSPSPPPPLSIGGGGGPAPSRKPLTMSTVKAAAGAVRWGRLVEYETNQLREEENRRRRRELKKTLQEEETSKKKVLKSAEGGGETPKKQSGNEKSNDGDKPTKADNKKKELASSNKGGFPPPDESGTLDADDDDFDFQTVTMAAPPLGAPFVWYRLGFSCVDPQPEHVSFYSTEQLHHHTSVPTPPPWASEGIKTLRSRSATNTCCSSSRVGLSDGGGDTDVFFSTHTAATTISASTISVGTRSSSAPIATRAGLQQQQQGGGACASRGGPAGFSQKQRKGAQLSFFFKIPKEYADKFSPASTEHPPLYVDKKGRVVPFVASLAVLADSPLTPSYRYAYYRGGRRCPTTAEQRRTLCGGVSGTNGSGSHGKTSFVGSANGEKEEAPQQAADWASHKPSLSFFRRAFSKVAFCNALALLCPRRSETFLRELVKNMCTSAASAPPRIRSIHYSVPDFLTAVGGGGSSSSASGSLVSSNTLLLIPNFGLILCPSGGFIAFDFSTPQHVVALLGAPQSVLKEIPTGSYNESQKTNGKRGKGGKKKTQQAPHAASDEEEDDEGAHYAVEGGVGGGGRGRSHSGGRNGLPPLSSSCGYIFTYPHLGIDIHFGFPPPAVSTTLASASALTALLFYGRQEGASSSLTTAIGSISDTVRHITVHSSLGSIRRGLKDAALRYQSPFASTCLILDPLLLVSTAKKATISTHTGEMGEVKTSGFSSSISSSTSTSSSPSSSSSSSSAVDSSTSENESELRDREDHPTVSAYPAVAVTLSTKWPALRDELTMGGRPRLLRTLERKVFETRDAYQNSQQRQQHPPMSNQLHHQGHHAHAHMMSHMIHTVALRGALLCFDSKPCAVAGMEHLLRVQPTHQNNCSSGADTWEKYLAEADTLNTVIIFRSRELFFDDDSQPHFTKRRRKKHKTKQTKSTSFSSSSSIGEEVRRIVLASPMSSPYTGFLTGACRDAVARVLWGAYAGPPHHSVRNAEKRAHGVAEDSKMKSTTKRKEGSVNNTTNSNKVAPLSFQGSGGSIRSKGGDERGEGVTRSMSMGSAGSSSNPPQHELPTSRHRTSISGFDQNHPQHYARGTRGGSSSSSSATPLRADIIGNVNRDHLGTSSVPPLSPTPPATASATPTIAPISPPPPPQCLPSLSPPMPSKSRTGTSVAAPSAQQVASNNYHQQVVNGTPPPENNRSQQPSVHQRDGCNKTVVKGGRGAAQAPQEVEFFDPFCTDLGANKHSNNNREGRGGENNDIDFYVKKDRCANNTDSSNNHSAVVTAQTVPANTQQGRGQQQQTSSSDWDEVCDNTNRRESEKEEKAPAALNRNAPTTYGGAVPTSNLRPTAGEQPTLVVTGGGAGGANLPRTASSWEDLLLTPQHGGVGDAKPASSSFNANGKTNNNNNNNNNDEDDEDSAFYQPSQPPTTSRRFFVREEGTQLVFTSEPINANASAAAFLPPNPFDDFSSAFASGVGVGGGGGVVSTSAAQVPLTPPPSLLNSERVGAGGGGTENRSSANPDTLNNNNNTNINNTGVSNGRVGVDRSLPPSRSPSRSYTPFSSTSASGVGAATPPSSEAGGQSFHPPQHVANLQQEQEQEQHHGHHVSFPNNSKFSRSSSDGRSNGQQHQMQQSASAPTPRRRKSSLMAAIQMPPETSCSSSNSNTTTHANSNLCTAAVSQSSPLITGLLGGDNNNNNYSASEEIPDETGVEGMFSEPTATATGDSYSYDYYDNYNTDETPLTPSPPRLPATETQSRTVGGGGGEATPPAAMTAARQRKLIRVPTTAYYSPPASSNSFSTAAGEGAEQQQQQQPQQQQPNAKSSAASSSSLRGPMAAVHDHHEDEGHEHEGTPDRNQHQQRSVGATTLSTASAPRSNHSTSSPSAGAATTATASPSSPVGPLTFDHHSSEVHPSHPSLHHRHNHNDDDDAVKRQLQFGRGARESEKLTCTLSEWGTVSQQWAKNGQGDDNGDENNNDGGYEDRMHDDDDNVDDDEAIQMYTPMSRSPATPYEQRDGQRDDPVARNVPSNFVIAPNAHLRSLYVMVGEKQQHQQYTNSSTPAYNNTQKSEPSMHQPSNNSHWKSLRNNREKDFEGGEEREKASSADHNAYSDDEDTNNDCFLSFGSSGGPTPAKGGDGSGLQLLGTGRGAVGALPLAKTTFDSTTNNSNNTARKNEGKASGHGAIPPPPPSLNIVGRSGSFMANSNNNNSTTVTTHQHNNSAGNSANNRIFYTPQSVAHSHAGEGASRSETPDNFALPSASLMDHEGDDATPSRIGRERAGGAPSARKKNQSSELLSTTPPHNNDGSKNVMKNTDASRRLSADYHRMIGNCNQTKDGQYTLDTQHICGHNNNEGSSSSPWGAPSSITTVAASERANDGDTDCNFRMRELLEHESTSNTNTNSDANREGTNNNTTYGEGGSYGSSSHDHRRTTTVTTNTDTTYAAETEEIEESHEVSSSGGVGGEGGQEGGGGGTSSFSASASAMASTSASASPSVSVTPKLGPKGLSPSLSPSPSPAPHTTNNSNTNNNNNNTNNNNNSNGNKGGGGSNKGKGKGGGGRGGGRKGRR